VPTNESASSFSKIWIVSTGPPQIDRQAPIEAFLLGRRVDHNLYQADVLRIPLSSFQRHRHRNSGI
jgi:hypothetical protein